MAVFVSGSTASCATGGGYSLVMPDTREALSAATRRYRRTEAAHEEARQEVINAVIAALRDGVGPTEVERLSPFTSAYIRKLARDNGVPPVPHGLKPYPGRR